MNKLAIFGAGGHAKVVIEIAESNDFDSIYICADMRTKDKVFDYKVKDDILVEDSCIIAVGDNRSRRELVERFNKNRFIKLIHKFSNVSKRAIIDEGTVVMAGATINADVKIGKHCIINTNSSIDHDCVLEDFVHISPNVALAGNVHVGEGTHVGVGVNVIPGVKIGKWCTIGAGAVIIRDVQDKQTVIGNPGKILRRDT